MEEGSSLMVATRHSSGKLEFMGEGEGAELEKGPEVTHTHTHTHSLKHEHIQVLQVLCVFFFLFTWDISISWCALWYASAECSSIGTDIAVQQSRHNAMWNVSKMAPSQK